MGKFFVNFLVSQLRSAAVIRYLVTIIAQAISTKFALDATQTGALQDWLFAGLSQIVAFLPVIINQLTRPSDKAMEAAEETDKIISGEKKTATVTTPANVPNITIKADPPTRGGQG